MVEKATIKTIEDFLRDASMLDEITKVAEEFNFFTTMGIVNNENLHSNLLAWLMNPAGNHQIGDYFLLSFLKMVVDHAPNSTLSILDIEPWDLSDAEIQRELKITSDARLDILITSQKNKFVCVIENKIKSTEHDQQLQRYKQEFQTNSQYQGYSKLFVYLTPTGETPESDDEYIPISYTEISGLLKKIFLQKQDRLTKDCMMLIRHYTTILERFIVEESELKEKVERIYKKHKTALDIIFEYRPDRAAEIRDRLVKLIKTEFPEFIILNATKTIISFIPKTFDRPLFKRGTEGNPSVLWYEVNCKKGRIRLFLVIGKGEPDTRTRLASLPQRYPAVFKHPSKWRDQSKWIWFVIFKKPLVGRKAVEEYDLDYIENRVRDGLRDFMRSEMRQIETKINEEFGFS